MNTSFQETDYSDPEEADLCLVTEQQQSPLGQSAGDTYCERLQHNTASMITVISSYTQRPAISTSSGLVV